VKREMAIGSETDAGGRWSVDHLLLDQDGVPTLIEVKRSSDTRIRREVVGQLLEYAANAGRYWSPDQIREAFVTTHGSEDAAIEALELLLDEVEIDADAYWAIVGDNLAHGRLRMIFLADRIPSELTRIIEFLNTSMREVEVLGVEVRRYQGGDGQTILAPRVLGQTQRAADGRPPTRERTWDRESFVQELGTRCGPDALGVAHRILEWFDAHDPALRAWFGRGPQSGSFFPMLDLDDGRPFSTFSLWTYGKVEIQFQYMSLRPFHDVTGRHPLLHRLNAIDGVELDPQRLTKRPSFLVATLATGDRLDRFLEVIDWAYAQVTAAAGRS
jgi:hypothetical protein